MIRKRLRHFLEVKIIVLQDLGAGECEIQQKIAKRHKIKSKKIFNFFSVCDRKMGPPLFDRYFLALHAYQVF